MITNKERIRKLLVCIGDRGNQSYVKELRRLNEILGRYLTTNPEGSELRNQIETDLISRYLTKLKQAFSTWRGNRGFTPHSVC